MGWKLWQNKFFSYKILVKPFYILCISLFSLLLPLSFLLLTRISRTHYVISLGSITPPNTFLYSLFLQTYPNLIHAILLLVSLSSLIHALTCKISLTPESPGFIYRPRVHIAWLFLCTLQLCVGLGIEAIIEVGANGPSFGNKKCMLISKLIFFVGLHESMTLWCRTIVRPIVDDTVYAESREERWEEKWAVAAGFGLLSWWRLRDEVELLVVVVEAKRYMMMKVEFGDFIGLLLYYLNVAIGISRLLKWIIWFWMKFFCRRLVVNVNDDDDHEFEDKV